MVRSYLASFSYFLFRLLFQDKALQEIKTVDVAYLWDSLLFICIPIFNVFSAILVFLPSKSCKPLLTRLPSRVPGPVLSGSWAHQVGLPACLPFKPLQLRPLFASWLCSATESIRKWLLCRSYLNLNGFPFPLHCPVLFDNCRPGVTRHILDD
jgi:hypothetical protein